jgi:hypothetical protein
VTSTDRQTPRFCSIRRFSLVSGHHFLAGFQTYTLSFPKPCRRPQGASSGSRQLMPGRLGLEGDEAGAVDASATAAL